MFNYFKYRERKRRELKYNSLQQFNAFLERCEFGTFQHALFLKAIVKLNENENPKKVINWVHKLEKDWNKI